MAEPWLNHTLVDVLQSVVQWPSGKWQIATKHEQQIIQTTQYISETQDNVQANKYTVGNRLIYLSCKY